MPEPLTYTVAEAAELIGISPWAYYEAIKRDELPYRRVGRRVVVPRVQLEAWLNKQGAA